MKNITSLMLSLGLLAGALESKAWFDYGVVYCDANTNGVMDLGDVPVPSVLVAVTNLSGTYSNASWTTAEGEFLIDIPATVDSYIDYIVPETLPVGTVQTLPAFHAFAASGTPEVYTNNFLIVNQACVVPPPPPAATNVCWLTGGGGVSMGTSKREHSFAGTVSPGCKSKGSGGSWTEIWLSGKLQFKSLQIEVVNCGNVVDYPPGSSSPPTPYNFIEFQGVGKLFGLAGNKTNYGLVYFYARAEDLGEPGRLLDRYYFRAYDSDGHTLLLVSATPDNPSLISPVRISSGNLQMHACKNRTTGDSKAKQEQKGKGQKKQKSQGGQMNNNASSGKHK